MIFLSGHGMNDSTGVYYFVPTNFDLQKCCEPVSPIPMSKRRFKPCGEDPRLRRYVVIQQCDGRENQGYQRPTGFVNELASAENGRSFFASATGKQVSWERPNGTTALHQALIEG